ncbi:MAG: RluA family pseudouridine synthase [Blastocatellia bacterium]
MNDQTISVAPEEAGQRLDKWLAASGRLGSRSRALEAIARGRIFLGAGEMTVADAGRPLSAGEAVRIWMNRPGSAARRPVINRRAHGLHIVFEDDDLIVLNKPAGLLTVKTDNEAEAESLERLVENHLRSGRAHALVVHRIDRETSGLVVFAKNGRAQAQLKKQFLHRAPRRIYLAAVHGCPRPDQGIWRDYLWWDRKYLAQRPSREDAPEAREAISHYRVLETFREAAPRVLPGEPAREIARASLLEISLVTGRQHQIRAQAALHGHQVVGEKIYSREELGGVGKRGTVFEIGLSRQALHAQALEFHGPRDNKVMKFEAPLPDDMRDLLARLRAQGGKARE